MSISAADVQRLVQSATGGENIATVIGVLNHHFVNFRYQRAFHDSLTALAASHIAISFGAQILLDSVANLSVNMSRSR